ncbi:MAG: ABC transporter substrate-binding protein, partial [Candidatus Hydrogenedentes bacterium]|nr:ABC transporter substrate-binding protein [Candidatus Hydrogenedentota bacterium]
VHMDSLATIDIGIETIGLALNATRRAAQLRNEITTKLDAIRAAVAPFERPKVFIVMGRERGSLNSLQTVGGASFISELVDVAGGDNIYKNVDKAYLEASKETLLLRAPDVILESHAGSFFTKKQMDSRYADWRALGSLPAWKKGRIYFFTDSHMMRPGPRVPDVARQIARKLHFSAELPE